MDSLPVPDELLVDIFLRIPEPADLVRASASCVSFRRLVADRSFLRKYRKIHAPPLLGFLDQDENFHPAVKRHPSAPAATAVAVAADFSFSFLPSFPARKWFVQDIRESRVVLDGIHYKHFNSDAAMNKEIVVCDPLHRRYVLLPPIDDDELSRPYHTFLVPSMDNEEASEETAFRVIWMARRGDKLVSLVFSSSTGQWQAGPSHSWRDSFNRLLNCIGIVNYSWPQCAYGCFYWVVHTGNMVTDCSEMLLVLDTRKMEFSIVDAPPEAKGSNYADIAIVEAGEGRPGMFVLAADGRYLNYIIKQNNCGRSSQWQFEKTISLHSKYSVMYSAGRYLFLYRPRSTWVNAGGFTLDVKTLKLERMFVSNLGMLYGRTYSNFPPSLLSTPTV